MVLIYIDDIADSLESLTLLFADDTSLSYSSYSYQLLETAINNDLLKINDWTQQKIPHRRNSSKIQYQNRRKMKNEYPNT